MFCEDNGKSSKLFEFQDTKKNHRKVEDKSSRIRRKISLWWVSEWAIPVGRRGKHTSRKVQIFWKSKLQLKHFVLKVRKKTSLPLRRINKMRDLYEHCMAALKPVVLVKDANGKLEFQITSQDISGGSWKRKSQHFWRFSLLRTFACTPAGCNPTGTFREKVYFKTDVRKEFSNYKQVKIFRVNKHGTGQH